MTRRTTLGCILIFAQCLLHASEESFGLVAVYEAALENDARLAAQTAGVNARLTQLPQLRSALLPALVLSGFDQEDDRTRGGVVLDMATGARGEVKESYSQRGWQLTLTQPVFDLSAWFQYGAGRYQAKQAQADLAAAQQGLIVRVAEAYLNVLRAHVMLTSAIAEESAVKRQLDQVQQRFDVGLAAVTDVLDATAARDAALVRRIQADGDQTIFFESLYRIVGRGFDRIAQLSEELPIRNPEPMDEEAWVRVALEQNWTVKAAEHALKAAERVVRARLSNHLPTVEFSAQRSFNDNQGSLFGGTEFETDSLVVSANLPIFQGGRVHYQTKEARYLVEEARWKLEETRRNVEHDARALYQAVLTDVHRVVARAKTIQSSQSALEATRVGYEVGTRTIVDVLQAERNLYSSRFDYADSRYRYVLDVLRLKEVAGTLSPADIRTFEAFVMTENPVRRTPFRGAAELP